MFDLSVPLYQQQLNKDLSMNIFIDGKWGSYRHLPLDTCATCMGEYHDSRRSFQLQVFGGEYDTRQVCVSVLFQILDTHLHIYQTGKC